MFTPSSVRCEVYPFLFNVPMIRIAFSEEEKRALDYEFTTGQFFKLL